MDQLTQDVRLAVRGLLKQRAFAAVVVLTLALAVGVNALVFSFLNFFLLRPLPIPDAARVVMIFATHPERSHERMGVAWADFADWREESATLDDLAAFTRRTHNLAGAGEPLRVQGLAATASLFDVWGLAPLRGRVLQAADDRPGAPAVAVLSHGFWARHFGSDPAVVGRTLRLDGVPHVVAGVLEPDIEIGNFSEIDLWTPLGPTVDPADREERTLRVTGRLKPGAEVADAATEIRARAERQQHDHPATNAGWSAEVKPFRQAMTSAGSWVALSLLAVAVALVLAVACANVANLMLARGAARQRETAVRAALGASRTRLLRQLFTEGLVLAAAGGALGLLFAAWSLDFIRSVTFEPFFELVVVDRRVLAFSVVLTLLSPVLFSLLPALYATRLDLVSFLKDAGGGAVGASRARARLRGLLVSGQLAMAVALLLMAGLAVRAAMAMRQLDLGFQHRGVLALKTDLPAGRYSSDDSVRAFQHEFQAALAAVPGVSDVAVATGRPVIESLRTEAVSVEGEDAPREGVRPWAAREGVSGGYFRTLEIRVLAGRPFSKGDGPGAEPTALVNQAFVQRYLGTRDPLGRRIRLGAGDAPWLTIVGVTANVVNDEPGEPSMPQVYLPLSQQPSRTLTFLVRAGDPGAVVAAARREMARIDPEQPLYETKTLERAFFEALASNRVITGLFGVFALVALALAAVGLYGLVSYGVSQRTREIGVRLAVGARGRDVVRLVMRDGLRLVLAGLGAGLLLGLALARAMASVLLGVSPQDPVTFSVVPATLALVALVATFVPARRAARLDPVKVLRSE